MDMITAAKKRILIVDDDEALRTALADQVAMDEGYEVVQSGTGAQALELARGSTFDTILLDIPCRTWTGARCAASCAETAWRRR